MLATILFATDFFDENTSPYLDNKQIKKICEPILELIVKRLKYTTNPILIAMSAKTTYNIISSTFHIPAAQKIFNYMFKTSFLLLKLFFYRMIHKYVIRDFHPLVLMIFFGIFSLFFVSFPLLIRIIYLTSVIGYLPQTSLILFTLFFLTGIQSLFFGLSLDMSYNNSNNFS